MLNLYLKMINKEDTNEAPLLDKMIKTDDSLPTLNDMMTSEELNENNEEDQLNNQRDEMIESFDACNKILNNMKKIVETMEKPKLMNYEDLFQSFATQIVQFEKEKNNLKSIKESLENKYNLPSEIKSNIKKIDEVWGDKIKQYEKYKNIVNDYRSKYSKESIEENMKNNNENNDENNNIANDKQFKVIEQDKLMENRLEHIKEVKKVSQMTVETSRQINEKVAKQGELIDNIETNIIGSAENFKKGRKEVEKFDEKSGQGNKKKLYIGIAISTVLILIIFYKIMF